MSGGPRPLVLDATVLTNFASTDAVDWLTSSVSDPWTPAAVEAELGEGVAAGYDFLDTAIASLSSDEITVDSVDASAVLPVAAEAQSLDTGETAAIALAFRESANLATDDASARQFARDRDIAVTGSVGLLARGVEAGSLSVRTADEWLDHWVERHQYYAPVDSVATLVDE